MSTKHNMRNLFSSVKSTIFDRYFIKKPRFRQFITRLLEGDIDKQIEICGVTLTVNSIKEHGYLRAARMAQKSSVFRDEVPVLVNLAFLLNKEDTFIDIGANVGLYTRSIARFSRIFPSIKIYAFEANPDTYLRLISGLESNVQAENVALSERDGLLQFVAGGVSHTFTTVKHSSSYNLANTIVSVRSKRLDDFKIEGESLIVKIDVEGQELEVMQGMTKLFESERVKAVYLDGYKNFQIEGILKNYGFCLFDGRTLKPTKGSIFSLLALHPDKNHLPS